MRVSGDHSINSQISTLSILRPGESLVKDLILDVKRLHGVLFGLVDPQKRQEVVLDWAQVQQEGC